MSRFRRFASNVDKNQAEIVNALNAIPGVGAAVGHDDILVGYQGRTYWFEIKSATALRKDGKCYPGRLKESQAALLASWPGHYRIVSTVCEILTEIGVIEAAGALTCGGRRTQG